VQRAHGRPFSSGPARMRAVRAVARIVDTRPRRGSRARRRASAARGPRPGWSLVIHGSNPTGEGGVSWSQERVPADRIDVIARRYTRMLTR
jgi:hypothetical protein